MQLVDQPPGYVPGTTAEPGLTFEEAQSQFVLWSVMKAPLILGVNHAQLATLSKDFPEYFNLISNPEIIAIDQDISGPAVVSSQSPSQQQQQENAAPLQVGLGCPCCLGAEARSNSCVES